MRQADHKRLDRLAGDGSGEVGIDLASLFRVILTQLQDSPDAIPADALTRPVQGAVSNHARVEHVYGVNGGDPWPILIGDALSQLESQKLAVRDDGGWRTGPEFTTGKRLVVVPARKGKHKPTGALIHAAAEREALGEAEKQRMEITSLGASLREDGPGLRPINPEHVETLAQSMRDSGYRPEFPVLVDKHGRILDGRHRLAASRKAGLGDPPVRVIPFASDEDAVGFALLVNLQRGWTKAERNHINSVLRSAGMNMETYVRQLRDDRAATREKITAALLDHPNLSHRKIAESLGVSTTTVGKVCEEVSNVDTSSCAHGLTGQGARTDRRGVHVDRAAELEELTQDLMSGLPNGRSQTEIGKEHGLAYNNPKLGKAAALARDRLKAGRPAAGPSPAVTTPVTPKTDDSNGSLSKEQALEQIVRVVLMVAPEDRPWLLSQLPAMVP